jgi:hypothetical protein
LTDEVKNRFERIIGKLSSCNLDPALEPGWIANLVRQRFGPDSSLPANLGSYLGAYFSESTARQIYFFEQGFGFVDAALQFPVYLRFVDIASFEIPALSAGNSIIRIRDKNDLLSCVVANNAAGDIQEVGRFFIRMHQRESDSSLAL